MMFSWLKYRSSFISRSVRRQNMEWSKGVIFLMATFWPEGLCSAELCNGLAGGLGSAAPLAEGTYHTTPYAPSPTTSWISYCSETLKEIFLELPLPAGGMVAGGVDGMRGGRGGGGRQWAW